MKKILIVGSDGQLAFDLIRVLKPDYEIIEAKHSDFDVSDFFATRKFIEHIRPDIVINTAAYNKTEEAERDPKKSFDVNAIGAYHVAYAASSVGAKVFYFGTNYVFDGTKDKFSEEDTPNPLNVYGASKFAGEGLTKIANKKAFIIRTSNLFGIHQGGKGYNFVSLMLEKAKSGEEVKVVNDQFGSPTYAYDLALKIEELIDRNIAPGTYHITNSGLCSWYEFAEKIFELSGVHPRALTPVSSERISGMKRPRNTTLVSKNLSAVGIAPLRSWQEALAVYFHELRI
ncbi:MAG: dTDP-4-dehydrorhamnose reductase [bacterium]|nr:dTDP-4-dehydrorhamnose reductase [bacterium]